MNTETNVQNKPNDNCNRCKIVNLGVKRDNDGLKITVQSPIDWRILKKNSKFELGGVVCFQPRYEHIDGIDGFFSTSQSHEIEGMPNLTIILAENIKGGVTFYFPPSPISDKKIKDWMENFKEQIKIIYLNFLKPIDYSVIITSQTIERVEHH